MSKINVSLPYKKQTIIIENRSIQQMLDEIVKKPYNKKLLITDEGIADKYSHLKLNSFDKVYFIKPDKDLQCITSLMENVATSGADRHSCIISLGGGTAGDIAGYIASQFMRGIDFIQISTSLMAMVDCIIGKVGINSDKQKNMYGFFNTPNFSYLNLNFLQSLETKKIDEALGEVLKHYFLTNSEKLKTNLDKYFSGDRSAKLFENLIIESIKIKKDFVQLDPFDKKNIHASLSYGHTFANGLESMKTKNYTHGEAVIIGMMLAANISYQKGIIKSDAKYLHDNYCLQLSKNLNLELNLDEKEYEQIFHCLSNDKMSNNENINMILLSDIGNHSVENNLNIETVVKAFENVKKYL